MKIVELVMDEEGEMGVHAISLVDKPAIESNFVHFSDQKVLFKADEEKRIILGAALIPDKPIYRRDRDEEYYVFLSKKTVRQAGEQYMKQLLLNSTTIHHEEKVNGVTVIESWFKEGEYDKSMNYGLTLPEGTWCVAMKAENDDVWQKVKSGELQGFSIEAYFIRHMEVKKDALAELEDILKGNTLT